MEEQRMLSKFKLLKEESGQVMLIFALLFVVLCGFLALVIDIGRVAVEKGDMQKAIDSVTLAAAQDLPDTAKATATANQYIQLNGYKPSDISITFPDSNKITISGTKEVSYTFARVLGFTSTTVNSRATAEQYWDPIFDKALFSDRDLTNAGGGGNAITVTGTGHANRDVTISGSNSFTIIEAHRTLSYGGSGQKNSGVPTIPMPDFAGLVKESAMANAHLYNSSKTFSGTLDANGSIYVKGDITIDTGTKITGVGTIYATGKIMLNNYTCDAPNYVTFYSDSTATDAIKTNGSDATLNGILYAHNGGIAIESNPITVRGSVISKLDFKTGAGMNIIGNPAAAVSTIIKAKLIK
jgi:hypothetical protein